MLNEADLHNFIGSEEFYRHLTGTIYTQGILHVVKEGEAVWLLNEICFAQSTPKFRRNQRMQVWNLQVNKDYKDAWLIVSDGNGNEIEKKHIPYTDFPFDITFWYMNGTVLLPSEY